MFFYFILKLEQVHLKAKIPQIRSKFVNLILMLILPFCLKSEAPSRVPGAEGKHQGEACWLRLPQNLQEVPQQVNASHSHWEHNHF